MIAKTFFGLEGVLADELAELGAEDIQPGRRMCSFRGDQRLMYRANVECRTAVRVLKPIARFPADGTEALYRRVGRTNWTKHLEPEGTLAIDPVTSGRVFTNSLYAAQVAKDAIVDQIRRRTGQRPSVDLVDPDLRINLHIDQKRVTVYLDASGESLHKRGYRQAAGEGAAQRSAGRGHSAAHRLGSHQRAGGLHVRLGNDSDRSGAARAADCPRHDSPAVRLHARRDFDASLHAQVMEAARQRELASLSFPIAGSDCDAEMIAAAQDNAQRAGVGDDIDWRVQDFGEAAPPAEAGTLVTNPPYDERLKMAEIVAFHRRIGDVLKHRWAGYTAWLLAGNLEAAKFVGLRPGARLRLFNGPIECRLLKFVMYALEPRDGAENRGHSSPGDA